MVECADSNVRSTSGIYLGAGLSVCPIADGGRFGKPVWK